MDCPPILLKDRMTLEEKFEESYSNLSLDDESERFSDRKIVKGR
jgi:hypothetical protein